jgi:hypothetical protein
VLAFFALSEKTLSPRIDKDIHPFDALTSPIRSQHSSHHPRLPSISLDLLQLLHFPPRINEVPPSPRRPQLWLRCAFRRRLPRTKIHICGHPLRQSETLSQRHPPAKFRGRARGYRLTRMLARPRVIIIRMLGVRHCRRCLA